MAWSALDNGALIAAAEMHFDALITTDQNLRYQQNLTAHKLAILVLPTTNWPRFASMLRELSPPSMHCVPAMSSS
jgi:hypothetical protein